MLQAASPRRCERHPSRLEPDWLEPQRHRAAASARAGGARRSGQLIADRGYDSDRDRRLLRERRIKPLIARRQTEHGSGLGRYRWVVERSFAWLHNFKRLLVRYERRAEMHEALLALGCCLVCFRQLTSSI
jgi:transposase